MKSALLSCLLLAFASHLPARTFTDAQGRKLVAVQQGQVRIKRVDGQEFTLPVKKDAWQIIHNSRGRFAPYFSSLGQVVMVDDMDFGEGMQALLSRAPRPEID